MNDKTCSSICLNMIVKDEAHIIEKTLNNILNYIPLTYWVICDTGSSDDTINVIERFFKDKKIKGEMHICEWKGFGRSRSEALDKAYNKSDYIFIFDADDTIHGDFKLPVPLNMDSYAFQFGQGFSYVRPLLITNRKEWKYMGVLHEYLTAKGESENRSAMNIPGDYFIESGRTGGRNMDKDKYSKDAAVFEREIATEPDQGLCDRYAFYLAQSYRDANNVDKSLEWYLNVLTRNNWAQEKYFSALMIGQIYNNHKQDFEKSMYYLSKSTEYDDTRFEGLIFLMEICLAKDMHHMVDMLYSQIQKNYHNLKLDNKLFVYKYLYDEGVMDFINVISCYYTKNFESGYKSIKKIAEVQKMKSDKMNTTLNNMIFYVDAMKNDESAEAVDFFRNYVRILSNKCGVQRQSITPNECTIFNVLLEKNKNKLTKYKVYSPLNSKKDKPTIMITFTTCKRFSLFTQTVNSIMNTWLDANQIDCWFCVDDNSSKTDRTNMSRLYPWMEFYMKSEEEKGHMESMNIIWKELEKRKPTYWIHMEDDFLFFDRDNYVSQAIKGLTALKKENVHQILFNRSYGETIDCYNIKSHEHLNDFEDDDINNEFCIHNFQDNKKFNYTNCHYWPHYSFRPSMMRTEIFLKLGDFSSDITFFEREYSNKYQQAGFKSGFFNKITNLHTGRLTKDKDNANIPNAYQLNNTSQFTKKKEDDPNFISNSSEEECNITLTIDELNDVGVSKEPVLSPNIKIVNLKRRLDRRVDIETKLASQHLETNEYEFVEATDGLELETTDEIIDMFNGNDFGNRKGVIGCALSHINIWKQLLEDKEHEFYMILEDDISFIDDKFKERLNLANDAMKSNELMFLSYSMFDKVRNRYSEIYNLSLDKIQKQTYNPYRRDLYVGGTFMYSINKTGARKILNYIESHGVKHGIDYVIKIIPDLKIYETVPQLCTAIWNENGKEIDSDIQNTWLSINMSRALVKDSDFVFVPMMDQCEFDLGQKFLPIAKLKKEVLKRPECVAFNSLCFLKSNVIELKPSNYFKENDGIYIKTSAYNRIKEDEQRVRNGGKTRVKMMCHWCSSEQLCKEWEVMCKDARTWNNIEFTSNDKYIDYFVIINRPFSPQDYYVPEKTIVFQMEPWVDDPKSKWGAKTWGKWAIPDETKFLKVISRKSADFKKEVNNVQWQMELTYSQLSDNSNWKKDKEDVVSCICSLKYMDPGHIHRVDFLKYIKKMQAIKEDQGEEDQGEEDNHGKKENHDHVSFAIFSPINFGEFAGYKGTLDMSEKSKGYVPYKYYFMCENNYEVNYITEKLWEPILCECLCFYYGCPNVSDYVNEKAYVQLDMTDFAKSYDIIKRAIKEDWWSQRIEFIRAEKHRILNEMQFCPRVERIIREHKEKKK